MSTLRFPTEVLGADSERSADSLDVTIVVVSYNTLDYVLPCIESVYRQTKSVSFEVIVVDNASADGSADAIARAFPQVLLIRSQENLGFARANNLAALQAKGRFLLLLNPDTVILDGAVQHIVHFAENHPDAGIYGGRTLFADGQLNPTSCWGRPTLWSTFARATGLAFAFRGSRWFDPESLGFWARDSVRHVDIVTGCFLLISVDLWRRLGGFRPEFFMYGEEVDLCLRARSLGAKPIVTPDATLIHHGGASEPVLADKLVRVLAARTRLMRRHWSRGPAFLGRWLTAFGCALRALGGRWLRWVGRPADKGRIFAWGEAWRRRHEWMGAGR
jgi:GT2 family glycosyltransferase